MPSRRPVLALVALALAAPAGASAATCPSTSVVFDSPSVVVTKGKPRRVRGGGTATSLTACVRATGARRFVAYDTFRVPHEEGDAQVLGLFGRSLLVEERGGGAESESTSRTLLDVVTGRRSEQAIVDGTDFSGETVAGRAGLLHLDLAAERTLTLHRPGAPDRELARGAELGTIALGADTAYWRAHAAAVRSAPVPPGRPGLPLRRWAGPAESTLQRVIDQPATGPVLDLQVIAPKVLAYRFAVGEQTAVVVYDQARRQALHAGLVAGDVAEVASGPRGIVATGPGGATLVTGRTVTALDPAAATDPAIAADGVAFWTTAAGPQSR